MAVAEKVVAQQGFLESLAEEDDTGTICPPWDRGLSDNGAWSL